MSVLSALSDALASATVEVVDLTAPLSSSTPVIKLPPPFSNTVTFALHEISRYDDRGPAWYWNDITTGEHTGTHWGAPCHFHVHEVCAGKLPPMSLILPAVVIDIRAKRLRNVDYRATIADMKAWKRFQFEHDRLDTLPQKENCCRRTTRTGRNVTAPVLVA